MLEGVEPSRLAQHVARTFSFPEPTFRAALWPTLAVDLRERFSVWRRDSALLFLPRAATPHDIGKVVEEAFPSDAIVAYRLGKKERNPYADAEEVSRVRLEERAAVVIVTAPSDDGYGGSWVAFLKQDGEQAGYAAALQWPDQWKQLW